MPPREESLRKLLKLIAEDESAESVETALRTIIRAAESRAAAEVPPGVKAAKLEEAFRVFAAKHKFESGQLVRWKKGMRNRKRPLEGDPAVVVGVLDKPVYDTTPQESSASTPYFHEPLDVVLGLIDSEGDFLTFHFDSRRFEPFTPART